MSMSDSPQKPPPQQYERRTMPAQNSASSRPQTTATRTSRYYSSTPTTRPCEWCPKSSRSRPTPNAPPSPSHNVLWVPHGAKRPPSCARWRSVSCSPTSTFSSARTLRTRNAQWASAKATARRIASALPLIRHASTRSSPRPCHGSLLRSPPTPPLRPHRAGRLNTRLLLLLRRRRQSHQNDQRHPSCFHDLQDRLLPDSQNRRFPHLQLR